MRPQGLRLDRVAEVIATRGGTTYRGSGYRVATGAVLTAAHVVDGADEVVVRFEADLPGEWRVAVTISCLDATADLAVLAMPPTEEELEPALFGRVGDRPAVLRVQAVGFPLWKMRIENGTKYRDAAHVHGSLAVLSNWREGTLEIVVEPPGDPGTDVSPWEGMSGAALWVDDRIVGVVARHHRSDGLGRLAATRLDRARFGAVRSLLPAELPDAVPSSPADRARTAHQELLTDIAPKYLDGRWNELADLVRFCAGGEPYRWLQAGPWAGKSALLAWFARFPPRGVDVVFFFITSRHADQSDSVAYIDALLEQLAALVGEPLPGDVSRGARRGHVIRLLKHAARRSAETRRRLLLVVDGLDEDTGAADGNRPSIASLLPAEPPEEVRVLVASRPHPALPDDVPIDHPLRTVVPVALSRSPYAANIERLAKAELTLALRGSEFQQHVLGLITASGGGLTRADIEHLTKRAPYELDALFNGQLGRSLEIRDSSSGVRSYRPGHIPAKVYIFSHETLRVMAEERFGATLEKYRNLIHAWADEQRERKWPADTSPYLLRGYTRMLVSTRDLPRLLALATDRHRQARLLDITGGDGLALAEITAATDLATTPPDFGALLLLAIARDTVAERNANIPVELPALWLALGHPTRALSLANGIPDPDAQANAFLLMAKTAYASGAPGTKRLVAKIELRASRIADPELRDGTLALLAAAAAAASRRKHPARLLAEVTDPQVRLAGEARCALRTGDHARAEDLIGELESPWHRALLVTELMAAVGGESAVRLADVAKDAIWKLEYPAQRETRWSALAGVLARAGDRDGAGALYFVIRNHRWRAETLVALVRAASEAGDHERVDRLITMAEQVAADVAEGDYDSSRGAWSAADATAAVALAYGAAGDLRRAAEIIAGIPERDVRDEALTDLVANAPDAGDRLLAGISDPGHRAEAGVLVARAIVDRDPSLAGELASTAERDARHTAVPKRWTHLLALLHENADERGDRRRAEELASVAERSASSITDVEARASHLTWLIQVFCGIGQQTRAKRLTEVVRGLLDKLSPPVRDDVLSDLAPAVSRHDVVTAETLAWRIEDLSKRARALANVAYLGDGCRVNELMRVAETEAVRIREPENRDITLTFLATRLAYLGDYERARRLVLEVGTDRTFDWQRKIFSLPTAMARLATAEAALGHRHRARELIDLARRRLGDLNTPTHAPAMHAAIAETLAALGECDEAELVADAIVDPSWQSSAWRAVGTIFARGGDPLRGERLVRRLHAPGDRPPALAAIARESTDAEVTARVLVELLTSEDWEEGAGLAARLAGDGVVDVIDTVLGQVT